MNGLFGGYAILAIIILIGSLIFSFGLGLILYEIFKKIWLIPIIILFFSAIFYFIGMIFFAITFLLFSILITIIISIIKIIKK